MKKKIAYFIVLFALTNIFANNLETYLSLLNDLKHFDVIGYKSLNLIEQQGELVSVNYDCSFAIIGAGFFRVFDDKQNIYYTRCGLFTINNDGKLMIGNNFVFLPDLTIDIKKKFKVTISQNAMLKITYENGTTIEEKINLFIPTGEITLLNNFYLFSKTEQVQGNSKTQQFFLEASAVNVPQTVLQMQHCLLSLLYNGEIKAYDYDFKQRILGELLHSYATSKNTTKGILTYNILTQQLVYSNCIINDFFPFLDIQAVPLTENSKQE